jgi:hypothetical protein
MPVLNTAAAWTTKSGRSLQIGRRLILDRVLDDRQTVVASDCRGNTGVVVIRDLVVLIQQPIGEVRADETAPPVIDSLVVPFVVSRP